MNKPISNKRSRGRDNSGRRHQHPGNRSMDSNGPEVKVRGTPSQICDKYLALARDASSAGDRVRAENLLQHAEHYFRLINDREENRNEPGNQSQGNRRSRAPAEVAVSGEMTMEAEDGTEKEDARPTRRQRAMNASSSENRDNAGRPAKADGSTGEEAAEAVVAEAVVVEPEAESASSEDPSEEGAVVVEEAVVEEVVNAEQTPDEASTESEVA